LVPYLTIGGSGGVAVPAGTTLNRPSTPTVGLLRYNTTNSIIEFYVGSSWVNFLPVVVTSPTTNQVVSYNGTNWVNTSILGSNASGNIGVTPSGGGTSWTLISGNRYYADFVHNIGTTNLTVTVWDTSDNSIVIPQSVVTTSTTTLRITVTGSTKTLKVVAMANAATLAGSGSLSTAQNGVTVASPVSILNFTGSVTVTDAGSGQSNIAIGSSVLQRYTFFANSLDTPSNSDFAVNALAPVVTDSTYTSLNIRSFSNVTETGVSCLVSIPTGATSVTIKINGRAQTAPGVASVVQPRLYYRALPNNTAVGTWSAAQELANISIPTNANFQYSLQTITLATLGLTAGNLYQIELTRRITGVTGTNLASFFYMAELTLEFA
jgi:hypothetical protein